MNYTENDSSITYIDKIHFYVSTTPKLSNSFMLLGYTDITFQSGSRIAFLFSMIQPFKDSFHCHLTIKSRTRNGLMCSKFLSLLYCITWKRYISNYDLRNFYSGTWTFCTLDIKLLTLLSNHKIFITFGKYWFILRFSRMAQKWFCS